MVTSPPPGTFTVSFEISAELRGITSSPERDHRTGESPEPSDGDSSGPSSALWSVIAAGIIASVLYGVGHRIFGAILHDESRWYEVLEVAVVAVVTCFVLWAVVLRPLHRRISVEQASSRARQQALTEYASVQEFDSKLHRALEMAPTEDMTYQTTRKALRVGVNGLDAEILLADSSDAHLKRALVVDEDGPASCGVVSPRDCPAIRRAQTLLFESSEMIDACPFLEDRSGGACAAACVPLSVGGRSIGVLHTATTLANPPSGEQISRLESIATQVGSRIGMLRVMSATTLQAATDPLTGLLNRRSIEDETQQLIRQNRPFALAMGDLDHFKQLNDTRGHEAGDRALRLYAQVLRKSLRSNDLISRYGGEEFVIVFPDLDVVSATAALERAQEALRVGSPTPRASAPRSAAEIRSPPKARAISPSPRIHSPWTSAARTSLRS